MRCSKSPGRGTINFKVQLAVALLLSGSASACAGGRASEAPPATAATEPPPGAAPSDSNEGAQSEAASPPMAPAQLEETQRTIDRTADKSEQLADRTAAQAEFASNHEKSVAGTPPDKLTDLERAATIRQAIMQSDGFSAGARNTRVLVEQGRVTLRGNVESAAEKARVEETARTSGGSTRIVNELVVGQQP